MSILHPYEISLNRVRDTVRIRENMESITLRVDADPARMVALLNAAQKTLKGVTETSTEAEQEAAALAFAGAIFGDAQAKELLVFYKGDPACVINVCGKYFSARLAKLIRKAQVRNAR